MLWTGRMRVALDDRIDALDIVTTEVFDSTGLTAEVELQELDVRGELVVEVRVRDHRDYASADLAQVVARCAPHLEVLSAWNEPADPIHHPSRRCQKVLDLLHCEIPDLALRAHRDGVPTARWFRSRSTQNPHWMLAVPGSDADRRPLVGICRRPGYMYRFSGSEAAALFESLT